MSEEQGVVLFYTIHAVFRLQKSLRKRGMTCRAIPTPRHLSSDCGTALRFPWNCRADVEAEIADLDLEIESIHKLEA
jgi:hypothetical protein